MRPEANGKADRPGVNRTEAADVTARGVFSPDPALARASRAQFDAARSAWEARFGDCFPLPAVTPGMARDFLAKARAARVQDVAITDFCGVSAAWGAVVIDGIQDQVWMHVVERGAWTIGDSRVLRAGHFLLGRGRKGHCATTPGTVARAIVLPAPLIKLLLGNRSVTGPADSAEARLLMAHAGMVQATAADLGPEGVQAAKAAMIELAKAVARGRIDDTEPQLASVLAQAAKDRADGMLADPGLSAEMLARELGVSVRTLQRAFTAAGEPVTAYIRRRRLEEARLALTVPSSRLSVTEIAAHWQFADASHFTRAFKARYGCAPAEYARMARDAPYRDARGSAPQFRAGSSPGPPAGASD